MFPKNCFKIPIPAFLKMDTVLTIMVCAFFSRVLDQSQIKFFCHNIFLRKELLGEDLISAFIVQKKYN